MSPTNSNLFDIKHNKIHLSLDDNQLIDEEKYGFIIKDSDSDSEYTITSEDVSFAEAYFNDIEVFLRQSNIYDLSFSDYGSDNNLPYATLSRITNDIKTFQSLQDNSNDYFNILTIKGEFLHFEDNNNDSDFDFKFAIYDSNFSQVGSSSISITGSSISNLVTVINNDSNLNQYIVATQDDVNSPTKLIIERIDNYYNKETGSFF